MTQPIIRLDPEQERDAQRIASEPSGAALDASEMSTGKTAVAIRVAQLRGARQILVVGPLLTRTGWDFHSKSVLDPDTGKTGLDLPFYWIRNHKQGELAKVRLQFGEPGVYFIGPEYATTLAWNVVKDKDGKPVKHEGKIVKRRNNFWDQAHPDMLIIDEIHRGASNARSQRYKTFNQFHAGFKLGLSGTPHGNFFQGIYPVTKVLWDEETPESSPVFMREYVAMEYDPWPRFSGVGDFRNFKRKWCREGTCEDESHMHGTPGGEKNPGAYFASLPCVVRREFKHNIKVDYDKVFVELSTRQRKAYDELERSFVTMIEGQPFVIDVPSTLRVRLRQATLGMFSISEDNGIEFAPDCVSTKIDALRSVLDEDFEGETALIFTDSKRFARVLVHRLADKGVTEEWSGDVSAVKREAIKQRFLSGATQYVVMVIKSGGTGTDLLQHATRNMARISVDDSRIENEQSLARVIRRGQGDLVRFRDIVAVETYDLNIISKQLSDALEMNRTMRLDTAR